MCEFCEQEEKNTVIEGRFSDETLDPMVNIATMIDFCNNKIITQVDIVGNGNEAIFSTPIGYCPYCGAKL